MSIFEKLFFSKKEAIAQRTKKIKALESHREALGENSRAGLLRESARDVEERRAVIKELIRRLQYNESFVGNAELEKLDADFNPSKLSERAKRLNQEIEITTDQQEKRRLENELSRVESELRRILRF